MVRATFVVGRELFHKKREAAADRPTITYSTGSGMRFTWLVWLTKHFGEYGYGDGPLRATIGTVAVLLTASLVGYTLRRHHPAGVVAAGLTAAVGIGWLAFH